MTRLFKDIKEKYGYPESLYSEFDCYKLKSSVETKELITFLLKFNDYKLLLCLLRESPLLSAFKPKSLYHKFFTACSFTTDNFQTYLENLDTGTLSTLVYHEWGAMIAYLINGTRALDVFFDEGALGTFTHRIIQFPDTVFREFVWWAAANGERELVDWLILKAQEIFSISIDIGEPLRGAIKRGNLSMVKYLVERFNYSIEEPEWLIHDAAIFGHFEVLNFLLGSPEIKSNISNVYKVALKALREENKHKMINFLLEFPQVRQSSPEYHNDIDSNSIRPFRNGLVRALWLELEKSPQFEQINSFEQLSSYAKNYLTQNTNWMHDDFGLTTHDLIASLKAQVLALRNHGFCDYVQISGEISNQLSYQRFFEQKWLEGINKFISLPTNLVQFEERPQLRFLANRCMKQRRDEKITQSELDEVRANIRITSI